MSSMTNNKMEAVSKTAPQRTVEMKIRPKSKLYSRYIYHLLQLGHEERSIYPSKDLMASQDRLASVASEAARLRLYNKRRVLTRREIESAMKCILTEIRSDSSK